MPDIDTEELRRLTREASIPWEVSRNTTTEVICQFVDHWVRGGNGETPEWSSVNAALIVAMRNALPDLIAALDAKNAEIERLREIENVYEQDQSVISDLHRKVRELAPYRKRAHEAERQVERTRAAIEPRELVAIRNLVNGTSLPMDMQPERERWLRKLDALANVLAALNPEEAHR